MENTISMQDMRHLNLFMNITRINTTTCFEYNDTIFFGVPRNLISTAIGENGKNSKELNRIIGKKIKVIFVPNGIEDVREFIGTIIYPVEFKNIEFQGNEMILHAGSKNKAALIGREKRRLLEMKTIVRNFFGKELRIV